MAVTANQVQSLYLAYFGRPAEQAGLSYWTAQTDATVDQISAAFAQQAEYTQVYGSLTRAQTIQELYTNLFNRAASDNEIAYWNASQDITVDRLALALVNGATGNDSVTLANKVDISAVLTSQAGANASATDVRTAGNNAGFDDVFTATAGTSASQQAAAFFGDARTTFVNQTSFSLVGSTLQNGNAVTQTSLDFGSATAGTVKLVNATGTTNTIALDADSALTSLTLAGTVGTTSGSAAATAITLNDGVTGDDSILTTVNVNASASKVGASSTTINVASLEALTTFDASASTAGVTLTGATALADLSSVKGGAGNDTLTVATTATDAVALTVDGGAGNDTIAGTVGSAALTLVGGAGNDTISLTTTGATAASTVNAGAGNDIINLAAGAFGTGNAHAVSIDLGTGSDTLVVTALANLRGATDTTATQLGQDLIKVANFSTGDKLDLGGLSYQALSTAGVTAVNGATTLVAAAKAAAGDLGATAHSTTFEFGGNTYVYNSNGDANVGAGDGLIELTGFQGNLVASANGGFTAA